VVVTKAKWLWIATGVAAVAIVAWVARPAPNDLAFLDRWNPTREIRVGDWAHPGDARFGTWTVLRFAPPRSPRYTERGSPESVDQYPDIETEISRLVPTGSFDYRGNYDVDYVDTIRDPAGGADRYLYVANGWYHSYNEHFQVWIKHGAWLERAWAVLKHRFGK